MNKRIKELRKALELSQDSFGKRLGITGAAISRMESGDRTITEQNILSIVNEFNVNEEWLRYEAGEMFNLASGSKSPEFIKNTFVSLNKLATEFTERDWEAVQKFINVLSTNK